MRRRRVRSVPTWVDGGGHEADWESAGTVGGSTRLQAVASLALRYGLWGGIALALVLGLVNCAAPATTPPPEAATEPPLVPPPGGCAELVVSAWLAGDTEALAGVAGVPRGRPEFAARQAVRTYTAAVTPGAGSWGYLVGAEVEVRDAEEEPWRSAGHQFFAITMVPVAGGCQGWAPASLPAQVAGPELASPALSYPVSLPASGTELAETLEAFFAGMLTGASSPERYVAPGTLIPFPFPPPYQQVAIAELRARQDAPELERTEVPPDGTVVPLLVTVETDPELLPLVYPVTVGVRGGRWEIQAMDPLVEGGY